ncbi:unnamed protein product [Dicrocoelium dendriticum]|nr:unnamed protein product [Dicrocoelium dendriticum]
MFKRMTRSSFGTYLSESVILHLLISLHLYAIYLLSPANAVEITFCPDLVPEVLSIEKLEYTNYLFGTEYNTLETLLSTSVIDTFATVYTRQCIRKCQPNEMCRYRAREEFLRQLQDHGRGSSVFAQQMAQEHGNYSAYKNREISYYTPSMGSMFATSCVTICHAIFSVVKNLGTFECLCRNPCKLQTSCRITHCMPLGIFAHQYQCFCPDDQQWNTELLLCVDQKLTWLRTNEVVRKEFGERDTCDEREGCYGPGTLFCTYVSNQKTTKCVCKPHFYGSKCQHPVDACETHVRHPYLPNGGPMIAGHKACNVNYPGNWCRSYTSSEGDVYYRCKCNGQPWIPNPALPYDNCLFKRTICESLVCLYGKCVTHETGTQAHCLCLPGYTGSACSRWVGEWTQWSPWDKCRPSCGTVRYSVRTRDCPSLMPNVSRKMECHGHSVEYAICNEHPCTRLEGSYVASYFAIRQDAVAATIANASIACAVISIIWLFFFWSVLSRVIRTLIFRLQRSLDQKRADEDRRACPTVLLAHHTMSG